MSAPDSWEGLDVGDAGAPGVAGRPDGSGAAASGPARFARTGPVISSELLGLGDLPQLRGAS
eukprot:2035292-Alexandrium_andersonii.AAC.1